MKQRILAALLKIQATAVEHRIVGICGNLHQEMFPYGSSDSSFDESRACEEYIRGIFVKWPEFSGDVEYPVPSDVPEVSAHERYWSSGLIRRWEGEYGESRKRLLDYMISELTWDVGQ